MMVAAVWRLHFWGIAIFLVQRDCGDESNLRPCSIRKCYEVKPSLSNAFAGHAVRLSVFKWFETDGLIS
jgi:hypothetical protein